jgi:hypothetical protein
MRDWAVVLLALSVLYGCASEITPRDTALPEPPAAPSILLRGPGEELAVLHTRPGVTVRSFVAIPMSRPDAPRGVILYYPGGYGRANSFAGALPAGIARRLVSHGFVVAVIDSPSDLPDGMESFFRITLNHARDQRRIVEYFRQRWPVPIYAVGFSSCAVTAAHLGAALGPELLSVIVLAAGSTPGRLGAPPYASVPSVPLHRIALPVLVVHHRDDGCPGATFVGATRFFRALTASPRVGFVEVLGGDPPPAVGGDPCWSGYGYHYFAGRTDEVADAMAKWIDGEAIAGRIAP